MNHENNRGVQFHAEELHPDGTTTEVFSETADPGLPYVPAENLAIHGVTMETMRRSRPCRDVALDFVRAVEERAGDDPIYVVAHNALFDRNVLIRAVGSDIGAKLGWTWVDTLELARKTFPEISVKYWPHEHPHSLSNLYQYFYRQKEGVAAADGAHNASADVKMTARLFAEKLGGTVYFEGTPPGHSYTRADRSMPLIRLSGVYKERSAAICRRINKVYEEHGDPYIANPDTVNGDDLVTYAARKCHPRPPTYGEGCKHIERMLRTLTKPATTRTPEKDISIANDDAVVNVLAHFCGLPAQEFYSYGTSEDGRRLFPSFPGEPISFKPLKLSKDQARALMDQVGVRTKTELYVKWLYTEGKLELFGRVNEALGGDFFEDFEDFQAQVGQPF